MPMRCLVLTALVVSTLVGTARAEETQQPARFLAVTVTAGFRHGSIATAEPVLEEMGRTSGLFHVDFLRMPPGRLPQPKPPRRGKDTSDADWQQEQAAFQAAQEQFKKDDAGWQATLKEAFAKAFVISLERRDLSIRPAAEAGKPPRACQPRHAREHAEGALACAGVEGARLRQGPGLLHQLRPQRRHLEGSDASEAHARGDRLVAQPLRCAVDADDLLAKADAKIAADPAWATSLRPMLVEIRGLKPDARSTAFTKLLTELEKP